MQEKEQTNEDGLPEGFKAVVSSNIRGIAFSATQPNGNGNDITGNLEVIFKNGSRWCYKNVPAKLAIEMAEAESIGRYFNANIKNLPDIYPAEEVKTEEPKPE